MERVYQKWAELQTIRLETKVVWSDEAHGCFNALQQRIGDLRGAIWLHFWMKGAYAGPGATVDDNADRVIENDKIVYFTSDNDEFSQELSKSVQDIEDFFAPKVRGR